MLRIIFFSFALIILSFIFVPVFNGVSKEHEKIMTPPVETLADADDTLSFEEIYEIAGQNEEISPEMLNNIAPAAGDIGEGEKLVIKEDKFSTGFTGAPDPAF